MSNTEYVQIEKQEYINMQVQLENYKHLEEKYNKLLETINNVLEKYDDWTANENK